MQKTKKLTFILLMIFTIILTVFAATEIASRMSIGKRLIVSVDPTGVYYFQPNQEGWYTHLLRTPHARINNLGGRGEDVDITNMNSIKKYIFLGDSFTFGWELENTETIPYYFMNLSSKLTKDKVINYGNGGYGIHHMIAAYEMRKEIFMKDDTLIMILPEVDFYRQLVPYQQSRIRELFWRIRSKSSSISWAWAIIRQETAEREASKKDIAKQDVFREFAPEMINFNTKVESKNMQVIWVFYEYEYTDYSKDAKEFCRANNLECINSIPEAIERVKNKEREVYAVDKAHPSAFSNEEVAREIINFINQENRN